MRDVPTTLALVLYLISNNQLATTAPRMNIVSASVFRLDLDGWRLAASHVVTLLVGKMLFISSSSSTCCCSVAWMNESTKIGNMGITLETQGGRKNLLVMEQESMFKLDLRHHCRCWDVTLINCHSVLMVVDWSMTVAGVGRMMVK